MRGFVAALFVGLALSCAVPAEAGFTRSSLLGSYGCIGHSIVNFVSAMPGSNETVDGLGELMQLNLSANGNITGNIRFNIGGEVCKVGVSPGSTFSVNPDGTGSMLLTLAASGKDTDLDGNCSVLNGYNEHFDILILGSGGKFDLQSSDDFITVPKMTGDKGDFTDPFIGSCEKQTPP